MTLQVCTLFPLSRVRKRFYGRVDSEGILPAVSPTCFDLTAVVLLPVVRTTDPTNRQSQSIWTVPDIVVMLLSHWLEQLCQFRVKRVAGSAENVVVTAVRWEADSQDEAAWNSTTMYGSASDIPKWTKEICSLQTGCACDFHVYSSASNANAEIRRTCVCTIRLAIARFAGEGVRNVYWPLMHGEHLSMYLRGCTTDTTTPTSAAASNPTTTASTNSSSENAATTTAANPPTDVKGSSSSNGPNGRPATKTLGGLTSGSEDVANARRGCCHCVERVWKSAVSKSVRTEDGDTQNVQSGHSKSSSTILIIPDVQNHIDSLERALNISTLWRAAAVALRKQKPKTAPLALSPISHSPPPLPRRSPPSIPAAVVHKKTTTDVETQTQRVRFASVASQTDPQKPETDGKAPQEREREREKAKEAVEVAEPAVSPIAIRDADVSVITTDSAATKLRDWSFLRGEERVNTLQRKTGRAREEIDAAARRLKSLRGAGGERGREREREYGMGTQFVVPVTVQPASTADKQLSALEIQLQSIARQRRALLQRRKLAPT